MRPGAGGDHGRLLLPGELQEAVVLPAEPEADVVAELAERCFGHRYLYPIQRFAISNLLEGRDQIVVLPTGAGKSLCFQLASQVLDGVTVVVVPLLALLEDQLRQCRAAGLRAAALRGGQTAMQRRQLAREMAVGAVRLLYATPEALVQERTVELFAGRAIGALVVDEAHCIAEWGPSFRPAYLALGRVAERFGVGSRAAFTATAGEAVVEAIRRELFGGGAVAVVTADADRPNLHYRVVPVLSKERALEQLGRGAHRPLVVFCRSRGAAEGSARLLRRRLADERVYFYHAGLDAGERRAVERWFLGSRDGVLAATSAYGMGVDKPDIRTVVHRDVPPSPEAYLQESGRAGRDGRPVQATLLLSEEDRLYAVALCNPGERYRYEQMLRYAGERSRCRRSMLLGFLGQDLGCCAGCDVCDSSVLGNRGKHGFDPGAPPAGQAEILAVARRHDRRLSVRELTLVLTGLPRPESAAKGLDRLAGFGILASWEPEDVEAALEMLRLAGAVVVPRRGPWRGRVTIAGRSHGQRAG